MTMLVKTLRTMRLNRREVILLASLLLCLVVPTAYYLRGDGLDQKLRSMAGPGATDCGTITGNEESQKEYDHKGDLMEACADQAHNAGKPFYMRQWVHMDGIKTTVGYVRTPEGKLYSIVYGLPTGIPFFISRAANIGSLEPGEPVKPRPGSKHVFKKTRYWLLR